MLAGCEGLEEDCLGWWDQPCMRWVWWKASLKVMLLLLLSRFSRVRLCATPETAAHQAPPSLGFSRQEHWSGLPFTSPVHESEKWKWSRSVVSDSSRPHELQPTRLLHPWDFPGKSTGVGCHCLLWINVLKPPKNSQWVPMAPRVIAHLPRKELYKLFLKLCFQLTPHLRTSSLPCLMQQWSHLSDTLYCLSSVCVFTPFPCLCFRKPCPSFRTHLKPSSNSFLVPIPTPKGEVIPSSLCSQSLWSVTLHHRSKCCNKAVWLHISFLLVQ